MMPSHEMAPAVPSCKPPQGLSGLWRSTLRSSRTSESNAWRRSCRRLKEEVKKLIDQLDGHDIYVVTISEEFGNEWNSLSIISQLGALPPLQSNRCANVTVFLNFSTLPARSKTSSTTIYGPIRHKDLLSKIPSQEITPSVQALSKTLKQSFEFGCVLNAHHGDIHLT